MCFKPYYLVILSILLGIAFAESPPPKTSITLNSQGGCSVHIGMWLSPSCAHCKDYFLKTIPKLTSKPGFCADFHLLPHMYPLDMPVAILVWSQGPENAMRNTRLFYENQDEWLDISIKRENLDDPKRKEDIEEFLNNFAKKEHSDISALKNYLKSNDPYLYVKIFALKNNFSLEHLQRYLPDSGADTKFSLALLASLPHHNLPDGTKPVVRVSPAFTSVKTGELIPEDQLYNNVLTEDVADEMLKKSGPPVVPQPPSKAISHSKTTQHLFDEEDTDDGLDEDGAQDADEEEDTEEHIQPEDEEIEEDLEEEHAKITEKNDHTTHLSKKLEGILDEQIEGIEEGEDHPRMESLVTN